MSALQVSISWASARYSSFLRVWSCWLAYFSICVFFASTFEFEPLAVGLGLLDAALGGFQLALRGRGAGAQRVAFRPDVGQFLCDAEDFPVAILQNEQLLDDFLHLEAGD